MRKTKRDPIKHDTDVADNLRLALWAIQNTIASGALGYKERRTELDEAEYALLSVCKSLGVSLNNGPDEEGGL